MDDMKQSKVSEWFSYDLAFNTPSGDLVVFEGLDLQLTVVDSTDHEEAIAYLTRKQARRLGRALIEASRK